MTSRLMTAILMCASLGTAIAQQASDPTTATQDDRRAQADRRELAERRQKMIEHCEREHGVDCEREVDTELRAEALPSGTWLIRLEGRGR